MMSFTDVMIRFSDGEKIKTLSSILEFPTTESLKNDYGRPIKTIDAEKFELNNIIDSVKESMLLNQMKAAEETVCFFFDPIFINNPSTS